MNSRRHSAGHAAAVLLAALLFAAPGCGHAPPPMPPSGPPQVEVSLPVHQEIRDYEDFSGQTESVASIDIRARVTGYLSKVNFEHGAEVKKGDILFEVDPPYYEAELARAEGGVAQAESRLNRLKADYERTVTLHKQNVITQAQFDLATSDVTEAEGTLKAARALLKIAQVNFGYTKVKAPVSGRVSRPFIDPGNLVKADDTILTRVVAQDPMWVYFDLDERTMLRLRRLDVKEEQEAQDARNVITTAHAAEPGVLDTDDPDAQPPSEAEPGKVAPDDDAPEPSREEGAGGDESTAESAASPNGARAEVALNSATGESSASAPSAASVESTEVLMGLADERGYTRRGVLDFEDNRIDPSTGTLRVRAVFSNADRLLSPGLFVRIRIPVGDPYRALLVPEGALGTDQGQRFVYVVNDKNEVAYRRVTVGKLHEGLRVISAGLEPNERVVVTGLQRVIPGGKVEAKLTEIPQVAKAP
jgi:multidrug efflux pump subunit AcrA (membrane-fusion protein)